MMNGRKANARRRRALGLDTLNRWQPADRD